MRQYLANVRRPTDGEVRCGSCAGYGPGWVVQRVYRADDGHYYYIGYTKFYCGGCVDRSLQETTIAELAAMLRLLNAGASS